MKTDLLNNILQVGARQGQVLQGTHNGAVEGRIRGRRALQSRDLGLGVDRRRSGLAVKYASSIEKLMGVALLVQEEPIWPLNHLNAKEVMQGTQVLQGKLITKTSSEPLEECDSGCRQNDVVDVQQQVGRVNSVMKHEEGRIGASRCKSERLQEGDDALVPGSRCLLQPVKRTGEQAHMIWMRGDDEAGGLLTEHLLS